VAKNNAGEPKRRRCRRDIAHFYSAFSAAKKKQLDLDQNGSPATIKLHEQAHLIENIAGLFTIRRVEELQRSDVICA
jgi:hypothetical protein